MCRNHWVRSVGLLGLLLAMGCGRNGRVQVSGTLMIGGKPATNGAVTFVPTNADTKSNAAVGRIQPDGRFELQTHNPGDGLVPGEYFVAVMSYQLEPGDSPSSLTPYAVETKYLSATDSGLTATVAESPYRQVIDFDVPARAAGGQ